MILVFLQNAYRYNGRKYRNREQWLKCLWLSHTGKRLKEMLPDVSLHIENANPTVCEKANDAVKPNIEHMKRVISDVKPCIIMACGTYAQAGMEKVGIPFISAPHPAWRGLSKKHTKQIRNGLSRRYPRRLSDPHVAGRTMTPYPSRKKDRR